MNTFQNESMVVAGAGGLIGQKLVPLFESFGFSVIKVSSQSQTQTYPSLEMALRKQRNNEKTTIIYLSYVKNPLKNNLLLLKACASARRYSAHNFFYFSTFAHNPDFCGIRRANFLPRYRSLLSFYNINKFFTEFIFVFLAKFILAKKTRCFVVSPGFVIGPDMIWTKMIQNYCQNKTLVCPSLHYSLPVVDVHEIAESIRDIATEKSNPPLLYKKWMHVKEFIEICLHKTETPPPALIEGSPQSCSQAGATMLPKEIFFYAKQHE